jgi:PilZ domain-containing protein
MEALYMMTKTERDLDRRTEPRIKAGLSVLLTTPNAHPMEACLLDVSPRGARLRVPEVVPSGTNVRIEAHELLLTGTVKRCCLIHGGHEVGIRLQAPIDMQDELRQLNAALLAESEPVASAGK